MRKYSLQGSAATWLAVVLVAGLGVAAAGCSQVNMLKARMALKDAHTAYQQQDYRGAIGKYEEAIAADATQTEAYFYLGNSYDNMYRPTRRGEAANDALIDNAVSNYKKAVELEQRPELRKLALQYLANAYGADKLNDPAQSEPVVQQLIDMDPADPLNYFALARIYEDSGDYERAEANARQGPRREADRADRLHDPGRFLQPAGKFRRSDRSVAVARRARADQP